MFEPQFGLQGKVAVEPMATEFLYVGYVVGFVYRVGSLSPMSAVRVHLSVVVLIDIHADLSVVVLVVIYAGVVVVCNVHTFASQ